MPSHDPSGTRLVELNNVDITRAATIFSQGKSGNEVPLVLIPKPRGLFSWWLHVPSDAFVLMQKCGAHYPGGEMCFTGAGLYFKGPWWRIAYLVTKQQVHYDAPLITVPTADNINVKVNISIVFSIMDPYKFVYELGVLRFDEYLRCSVDEAIRMLVRNTQHTELFNMKGEFAQSMMTDLNAKFADLGVCFSFVIVTDVQLPDGLMQLLSNIQDYRSQRNILSRQNEFEIKKLEDEHKLTMANIRNEHDKLMISINAKKNKALVEKDSKVAIENERRTVELIKADEEVRVAQRNAETVLAETRTQCEGDIRVARLNMETKHMESSSKFRAEANVKVQDEKARDARERKQVEQKAAESVVLAQAKFTEADNRIRADVLSAEAEMAASDAFKDRRQHEILIKKLDLRKELASSGKVVITGDEAHEVMSSMGGFLKGI
eukprot:Rmarinus@m.24184